MAKGRQLKNRLRQYHGSRESASPRQPHDQVSVTDRLAQLRVEHARALQNRSGSHAKPIAAAMAPHPIGLSEQPSPSPSPRVAGPRPPPSWTAAAGMSHQQRVTHHARTPPPRPSYTQLCNARSSSLRTLCARLAVDRIVSRPREAARLSVDAKQWVLHEFGNRLTDGLLRQFAGDLFGDLCLCGAQRLSFAVLIKTFWKTVPFDAHDPQEEAVVDDWEDWEQHADGGDEHDDMDYDTYVHHNDYRLAPVLDLLGDHHPILMTPLSAKLVALDISFMPQLDPSFFYLVAFTLPHLTRLVMAGSTATPETLLLLSRELKFLTYWDIGYHTWLTSQSVRHDIQWERDLKRLQTLCIVAAGPDGLTGRELVDSLREIRPRLHIEWE